MIIHRQKALFFLLLSMVGIILLAMGLPVMQLQPGLPIPGGAEGTSENPITQPNEVQTINASPNGLLQGALALGFVLLLLLFLVSLIRKVNRKRLLQLAAVLAVVFVLVLLIPQMAVAPAVSAPGGTLVESPPDINHSIAPIGNPPATLYRFVIGFLLLSALMVGAWLLKAYGWKREREHPLARETEAALRAIDEGQDLKNVIIRCYLNMAKVLKEEKGIEREESVTPREFETWLALQGVPNAPIRQLTRLFEKARYGDTPPEPQDEQAAVECLSAILTFSKQNERIG